MNSELKVIPLRPLTNTPESTRNELSYNSTAYGLCPKTLFFPLDGRPLRLNLKLIEYMKSAPSIEQSKPYD